MTISYELKAKILRYHHVEKWCASGETGIKSKNI